MLPQIPCDPGDNDFPISGFQGMHFRVRVLFASTTNKARGKSFSGALGLYLRD